MKQCKQCNKPITGKKKFCSDACRKAFSRSNSDNSDTQVGQNTNSDTPKEQLGQIADKPTSQAMTADKFKVIKSKLAGGVAQPTGLPTKATKAMTAVELRNGVSSYTGQDWLASSEYAEVCLRLVTWTKAKLIESGQAVPAWKDTL